MVEVWWSLLGAAIPAIVAGKAFLVKKRRSEEQRIVGARGREKTSDDIFVCERVCTSKRMLKKVGAFSKDPIADTCVTVCGVSELDACSDACARTCLYDYYDIIFSILVINANALKSLLLAVLSVIVLWFFAGRFRAT
ncbi:hypothetical protein RHSIM_Rhsim08G0005900 [Rhododendron simsii]|uniref:Uncharacterized protein n=1 Tax=Rhododendron simsii TaxID=118357 RepID=A0A834LHR3_RHOSS|nr:hypothetical protein RHSIM_Rhsim08G0005900 [Rhododendron simsii]